jgi:hypothetical protein
MATKKSAEAPPKSIYVPLRMPTELHARVEMHRQALSQAAGGAEVAFSFAVFHLVQAGLDAQQAEGGE